MTKRVLLVIAVCTLIISGLVITGCRSKSEPLQGLTIAMLQVEGDQTEVVTTALATELVAKGAVFSGIGSGVILEAKTVLVGSNGRIDALKINIRSRGGNLSSVRSADVQTMLPALLPGDPIEKFARVLAAQVIEDFSREYSLPKKAVLPEPPQTSKIG